MEELANPVSVRFTKHDHELLRRVCAERGEDMSDFVRRVVRRELARLGYLGPQAKKALEVVP